MNKNTAIAIPRFKYGKTSAKHTPSASTPSKKWLKKHKRKSKGDNL